MNSSDNNPISRRALVRVALIGAGTIGAVLTAPDAALAATDGAATPSRRSGHPRTSFIDLESVRAEYREELATFPLKLPEGWSFPPQSRAAGVDSPSLPAVPTVWEKGAGHFEVYMFWLGAVAAAACNAHARGDDVGAEQLLDLLEAGYDTPQRRAALPDPENSLVRLLVDPARLGNMTAHRSPDFSNLLSIAHS